MPQFSRQPAGGNARSTKAMIATPHWLATEAGARVLARGGNAIEALVAAGAALAVAYPHFCGLGGDAVWMVSDAKGEARTFLGIGQAAAHARPEGTIPVRGPQSTLTTAALVDSWDKLLSFSRAEWNGRESLGELIADAIEIAETGFPVSPSQRFWHDFRAAEIVDWLGFAPLFQREGVQRQPQLAASLRAIAERGARDFYEGELAQRIAYGLAEAGSPLTVIDLAATRTEMVEPLRLAYRDVELLAPPPPTQGVTTLGIMGVLRSLAVQETEPADAQHYHLLVEAVKQAFLDRAGIADPAFAPNVAGPLLEASRLREKAEAVAVDKAQPWPHVYRHGDTSLLAAVDGQGRAVSLLQSIYFDWGSGVVAGDTGILWQNRGAAFSTDPQSPNCYAPGKRPFYTLNPGLALKDGRPHLVYGTQGADGQPQTLALILSLMIDHGLDPAAALARPRFLLGKTFSDSRDSLKIEENAGADVLTRLAARGHEVSAISELSPLGGQAGVIRIGADGAMDGAHDPRSDGGAIGL